MARQTRNDRAAGGEFFMRRSLAFARHAIFTFCVSAVVGAGVWFAAWHAKAGDWQRGAAKLAVEFMFSIHGPTEEQAYMARLQPWLGEAEQIARNTEAYGITAFSVTGLLTWFLFGELGRAERQNKHRRGVELVDKVTLYKKIMKSKPKPEFQFAGLPLPNGAEREGILILGSTGSGKSTAMHALFDQIRAKGEGAIFYDPGGHFMSVYARPGDVLLNPYDRRADDWSIFAEIQTKQDASAVAASLVPMPKDNRDIWAPGARSVLTEVLWRVKNSPQPTMRNLHSWLLATDPAQLAKNLAGTPAAAALGGGAAPEQAAGMMGNVAQRLDWLEFAAEREASFAGEAFSLRHWMRSGKKSSVCFVTTRADLRESLKPLISLWFDLAAREILSLGDSQGARRIWFFIDELADMDKQEQLGTLLSQGRKYGAASCIITQNISQLREIYGRDGATSMLDLLNTKLIMRATEPETAEWAMKALGEQEIERKNTGENSGGQGLFSQQQQIERTPIVMASSIMNLRRFNGYLALPGYPRTSTDVKPLGLKPKHKEFEPC